MPPADLPPLMVDLPPTDPGGASTSTSGGSSSLDDSYRLCVHRLGRGNFSEVRLAIKRQGNARVAVKVVRRRGGEEDLRVKAEVDVMLQCARLQCPYLLCLLDAYETPTEHQLVLELLSDGTLLTRLKSEGTYDESDARELVRQLATGLAAMHVRRRQREGGYSRRPSASPRRPRARPRAS